MDEHFHDIIEFFVKLGKTRHQNSEFGPKPGEIKKKPCKKGTLAFKGGVKLENAPFFWGAKLSFIRFWPPLSFLLQLL